MDQMDRKTGSDHSNNTVTEMNQQSKMTVIEQGKDKETKIQNEEKTVLMKMHDFFSKENRAKIKQKGKSICDTIKQWGRQGKNFCAKRKQNIQNAWNKIFTQERKEALLAKWNAFMNKVQKIKTGIQSVWHSCIKMCKNAWNKVWTPQRQEACAKVWNSCKAKSKAVCVKIASVCQKVKNKCIAVWFQIFTEERRKAMKDKWNAFVKRLQPIYEKAKSYVLFVLNKMKQVWAKLTCEKNKQAVKSVYNKIKNAVVKSVLWIKEKVVTFVREIKEKETKDGLRTRKLFYISDYEKEAAYLRDMSLKGYHFIRNDGFSFDFIKGEPKNYFYLLDYYKVDPSQEEMNQWHQDGWEDIFHAPVNYEGSWYFFRRELSEGDMFEYNENNASRLELFERLTKNWQGILSIVALCTVFSIVAICMQIALHGFPWMIAICIVLAAICGFVFLIYLNMYYRTRLRIIDIHNAQKQKTKQEESNVK